MITLGLLVWLLVGFVVVAALSTRTEVAETAAAFAAITLWPLVLIAQVVQLRRRHRREAERQARITAKVRSGEYTIEQARRLHWRGADHG
jgi:hypothetical protein